MYFAFHFVNNQSFSNRLKKAKSFSAYINNYSFPLPVLSHFGKVDSRDTWEEISRDIWEENTH